MDADRLWLALQWPFVKDHLPATPARVMEIGCGPLGGFVPSLRGEGYAAVGVDPEAPDGPGYHRVRFEDYRPPQPVHAVVACVSLHHVGDLDAVLDQIHGALTSGGLLVVVEWAWERFDEPTARWCFARLAQPGDPAEAGWLQRHQDRWIESGLPWPAYLRSWVAEEGLHAGGQIVTGLDARFHRRLCADGPYFFADLAGTTEADEQAAIDNGDIQANGVRYVGQAR